MIRTLILAGVAALSVSAIANAQPVNSQPMNGGPPNGGSMNGGAMNGGPMNGGMRPGMASDGMGQHTTDFITKAAQSDEFERREGRLAETRSHNPHVKHFASMMVSAHTKTTMDLKRAIRAAGTPPPPPPMLRDDQMRMIGDLKGLHGRDFDRAYIDQQVQAHQDALNVMQNYAQNGHPGPIRDAAAKTAPLVQQHLDMAKDIQGHMGG